MKTIMMAILALTFTSVAHAGYYQHLETCTDDNAGPDHGYTIEINTYHASQVGEPSEGTTYATINEDTFVGRVEIGNYEVTFKKPAPRVLGSMGAYVGQDFYLNFPLVPSRGGKVANLTAVGNQPNHTNTKINQTFHCNEAPNL